MNEWDKRKFDAWESIRDHAWREFEDKVRAEWRLSFGIWAALLAAAGALLGTGRTGSALVPPVVAWIVVAIVVIAHAAFLFWIQTRLQGARGYLSEAQGKMRTLLNEAESQCSERSIRRQVPMYVELVITLLLAGILVVIFQWSASG